MMAASLRTDPNRTGPQKVSVGIQVTYLHDNKQKIFPQTWTDLKLQTHTVFGIR
jgi:hypothetical protein